MKPRNHDPLRLDVESLAKEGGRLQGRWPLAGFERLVESAHAEARPTAAEIDADSEDDVLVLTRALNMHELVEDELILSLPLVPMHETCPRPLVAPAAEAAEVEERPNPFAALAALKRKEPH